MPPYENVLSRFGRVFDFRIDALDRLGVPVTSCSLLVDGRIAHHGNGYGADESTAGLSGLGELAEGVLGEHAVATAAREAVDGSYRELVGRYGGGAVIDPATLCLPAGSDYTPD